jgi:ferredoxin
MRLQVDPGVCISCGLCTGLAPTLFTLGDASAEVVAQPAGGDELASARAARDSCPVNAISLSEE